MVLVMNAVPSKVAVVANGAADVDDAEEPFV